MKDHTGCKRAYIRSSKAWYAIAKERISVMIGMYHPDGSTSGEFEIVWEDLGNYGLCARLKSFEDSWNALHQFHDLLKELAEIDGEKIQEPELCKLLDKLGIIDITENERPNL